MKNIRTTALLLIAAVIGAWLMTFFTVAALLSPPAAVSEARKGPDDPVAKAIAAADGALRCKPKAAPFEYRADVASPFRLAQEAFAPPASKRRVLSPVSRVSLVLKGVLLKDKPLAILEDEKGGTFICGIGEKVQDLAVESIGQSSVQLRGPQGAITLSVKE
jgi:hypothetical protein